MGVAIRQLPRSQVRTLSPDLIVRGFFVFDRLYKVCYNMNVIKTKIYEI